MVTEMNTMQCRPSHLVDCIDKRASVGVEKNSPDVSPRTSTTSPPSVRLSPKKPKDDIRHYFRPVNSPKEDIRVYFRPVNRGSRIILDRPRPPKSRPASSAGKPKVGPRPQYEAASPPSPTGPKVPPKAKARTSGEKSREIFLARQRQMNLPGRTAAQSNSTLPGFDPAWTNDGGSPPQEPTSPRITDVVDRSLMPLPLRTDSTRTLPNASNDETPLEKQDPVQAPERYQQPQERQKQTLLNYKPDSVYGTLPPLPVQLMRNNSQPVPHSPETQGHRRKDTPYSPDSVGRTSIYASSEVLPAPTTLEARAMERWEVLPGPSALEIWASERRRIAHGQPQPAVSKDKTQQPAEKEMVPATFATDKEMTLKKAKSLETKLFTRSAKKSKAEKKEQKEQKANHKRETSDSYLHHPGARWDVGSLPPSPEITRSAMSARPRSDSGSDKMVVSELTRARTEDSSLTTLSSTVTVKLKKPNKFIRMLEAYSKNVEGLQMVQ